MEFSTYLSSPARIPAFEARFDPQDGQDLSLGIFDGSNTHYAAGSVHTSPLPSTCPPTISTSQDQLRALFSTCLATEVNAGRDFGFPYSDSPFTFSPQGSEWSSDSSSSPSSSITSPVSEDLSFSFASPDLAFQGLSLNDQDPLQAYPYAPNLSFLANDQPYQTPPKQSLFQPVALPEVYTPDMSVVPDQNVGINNAGASPGSNSFPTAPPFSETTALGLYYPNTLHSLEIPPLSNQAEASILPASPVPPATTGSRAKTRKVRAVDPIARTKTTGKRVRSGDKMHAAAAAAASAVIGTVDEGGVLKCLFCEFRPSSPHRGADLRRHQNTHPEAKEIRYKCCGVPAGHPAAAGLGPVYSVRVYNGREFYGGCGKSYSRMDALQRHSGKSDCVLGTAKDHKVWRGLYYGS